MTVAGRVGRSLAAAVGLAALLATARPATAQLVSIGDRPPERYELLGRFRLATFPVVVSTLATDEEWVAFVHTATWGGRIEEHGDGIINKINSFTLATQGITNVRGTTVTRGGQTYSGYSYDSAAGPRVPGVLGHWSLDLSDDVWQFEAQTYWNRFAGFHFDFWALRGYDIPDLPSQRDPDGKGERFVAEHGATIIDRKRAFDIGLDLRLPLALARGRAGFLSLEASLPIVYLMAGWLMAVGDGYESSVYLFGFPTVSADWRHGLGPLAVRTFVKVPSRLAIIPWHVGATEVGFEAGLRF